MLNTIDPTTCRVETVIAALLCMMTAYQRHSCRKLAQSIATHLDCLAQHPDAARAVREIAGGMCSEWKRQHSAKQGDLPKIVH